MLPKRRSNLRRRNSETPGSRKKSRKTLSIAQKPYWIGKTTLMKLLTPSTLTKSISKLSTSRPAQNIITILTARVKGKADWETLSKRSWTRRSSRRA